MAMGGIVGLQEGGSPPWWVNPKSLTDAEDLAWDEWGDVLLGGDKDPPFEGWHPHEVMEWEDPTLGGQIDTDELPGWERLKQERRAATRRHLETGSSSRMGRLGRLGGKLIKGIGALGLGADLLMSPEHAGAGTVPEPGRTAEERKALMDHARSSLEEARSFGMASIEQPRSFSDVLHGRASGGIVGLDEGGEVPHPWHHREEIEGKISEIEELNRYVRQSPKLPPRLATPEYLSGSSWGTPRNPEYARAQRELAWLDEDAGIGDPDSAATISGIQERMRGLEEGYLGERITSGAETGLPSIADISGYSPEFGELSDKLSWYSGAGDEGPIWREKAVDDAQAVEDAVAEAEAAAAAASAAAADRPVSGPPAGFDIEDHPLTAERMERMEAQEEWLRKPTDSEVAYESFLGDIAKQYRGRIPSDEQNLARERSEILDSLIAGFGGTGTGGFSKAFREAGGTKDVWLERDRQKAEREKYEDASDEILARRHGIQTLRSRQNVADKADTILSDLLREIEANKRTYATGQAGIAAAYQQVVAANLFRDPKQYEAIRESMRIAEIEGNMTKEQHDFVEQLIVQDIMRGMSGGPEPGVETTSRRPVQFGPSQTGSNVGTP
jgi:hypothetical protein